MPLKQLINTSILYNKAIDPTKIEPMLSVGLEDIDIKMSIGDFLQKFPNNPKIQLILVEKVNSKSMSKGEEVLPKK